MFRQHRVEKLETETKFFQKINPFSGFLLFLLLSRLMNLFVVFIFVGFPAGRIFYWTKFTNLNILRLPPTSSQCYKLFTDLYLQVCKYRPIFEITWCNMCCQIHYYHAFQLNFCYLTEKTSMSILNLSTHVPTNYFKNRPLVANL